MNRQADTAAMTLARVAALAASVIFVSFLVVGSSRAAFSGSTSNPGNDLSSGSVTLTDDDAGTALFTIAGMVPGTASSRCITVTYTGDVSLTSPVALYTTNQTASDLDPYVFFVIETGSGATDRNCSGFVADGTIYSATLDGFTTRTDYASGVDSGWIPTATGQSDQYRISVTLQDDNAAQAKSSVFDITWEARD